MNFCLSPSWNDLFSFGPDTLAEARARVIAQLPEGSICPACDQYARSYKRALNAAMTRWLLWLVRAYSQQPRWYSFRDGPIIQHRKGGGDFAKLLHWQLIERAPPVERGKSSGYYRPTALGIEFAEGRANVPSHVFLYDNKVTGWSKEKVSVYATRGVDFNLDVLLAGAPPAVAMLPSPPEPATAPPKKTKAVKKPGNPVDAGLAILLLLNSYPDRMFNVGEIITSIWPVRLKRTAQRALWRLVRAGVVVRLGRGDYAAKVA